VTFDDFVDVANARRTGPNRAMAKCPAHRDDAASLSIGVGRDGRRVLLNCFAGCQLSSILAAMGLKKRDLFAGPPPTPAQRARMERKRAQEDAAQKADWLVERELSDLNWRLIAIIDALGAKLFCNSEGADGDAMQTLFHRVCDRQHAVGHALDVLEAARLKKARRQAGPKEQLVCVTAA
jgi:hypothetical protein